LGVSQKEITAFIERSGYIKGEGITKLGIGKGLELKQYMGREYVAYPVDLVEFKKV
jgi:hypothetical protein